MSEFARGVLVEKDLSVRVHKCPTCGLVIDRDENAAINILRWGYNAWVKALEATCFSGWSSHSKLGLTES